MPRRFWMASAVLWCAAIGGAMRARATNNLLAAEPGWPRTRAERTDYRETSHYDDVVRFLDELQARGGPIAVQFIGESTRGKKIPLVVASRPPVANGADARRHRKVVVYVQANIHGGEVEGKEAALMLLRQLAQEPKNHMLDKLVLVITPIYNIDGNEDFGDTRRNRPSQDGPAQIGVRANGVGLDLNRDCMKVESPEMRAALRHIYTSWDPDVVIDLHTTNGTRHGYHLTYAPPLNPNTDANVLAYARDELLPTVRKRLARGGVQVLDYGNDEGRGDSRGWKTFSEEPRFVTNYVGLRNRIGVLSEAASFLPFATRVDVTLKFTQAVLDEVVKNSSKVLRLTRGADARVIGWGLKPDTAPPLGVRFEMASRGVGEILLEKKGAEPSDHSKAPTVIERVKLPVFDRFRATRTQRFPSAYFIPASASAVGELLQRHGIIVERLKTEWSGAAEEFVVTEVNTSPARFMGPATTRLEGKYAGVTVSIPAGDYVVRTAQPLGILAFQLLEPESLDGAAAWGLLKRQLIVGDRFPIPKTFEPVRASTEQLSGS